MIKLKDGKIQKLYEMEKSKVRYRTKGKRHVEREIEDEDKTEKIQRFEKKNVKQS